MKKVINIARRILALKINAHLSILDIEAGWFHGNEWRLLKLDILYWSDFGTLFIIQIDVLKFSASVSLDLGM
jgi:hypothetical protein